MSKEEKAVRDALAQLEKDAAVSDAAVARMNQPAVTPIPKSEPVATPKTVAQAMAEYRAGERGQTVPTGATGPTGSTGFTGSTGVVLTDAQIRENERAYDREQAALAEVERKRRAGQSAYDLLLSEFNQYGLGTLVEPLKGLIVSGPSEAELTLALRQTDAYKKRFAANAQRVASGLRALSEGEYVTLEDQYQSIMRNYGLPATYYTKDATGKQEGFEKFIAGDVSPAELEDRISIAQKRVIDAAPQVKEALKQFYPDIKDGDILAYTLDPTQGLANIQKKVLAAEIGGAAIGAGLGASSARAEELARYGVTAESAKQGYGAIGGGLERGRQLSSIYQEPDYNQAVAEEEIFNLPGQTKAGEKRKKIIGLEKATFGGQTGVTSGALSQNRAGSY